MLDSAEFFNAATQPGLPRDLISDDARVAPAKPLWALAEAADAARELARGGAAVTMGEVFDFGAGTPRRLDLPPNMAGGDPALMPRSGVHWRYRRWSCSRAQDESWDAFAARAAGVAADYIAQLGGAGAPVPPEDLRVDLAWTLPDEQALFDRPYHVRERCEAAMHGRGGYQAQYAEQGRVARASPTGSAARGSFFGSAALSLEEVPTDARYVFLTHSTSAITRLAGLPDLESVACSAPVPEALAHIGRLPRLRHLDVSNLSVALDALAGLGSLQWLSISQSAHARSGPWLLAPLEDLDSLRYLYMRACLRDLDALPALPRVTTLQLEHLVPRLASLAPIARLTALQHLAVHARRIDDASLAELATLRHVQHFELWSDAMPLEQYTLLARAWPDAEGTLRTPWQRTSPPGVRGRPCVTCHGELVQTLARPRKTFCPHCDPQAADRATRAWDASMRAAPVQRRVGRAQDRSGENT